VNRSVVIAGIAAGAALLAATLSVAAYAWSRGDSPSAAAAPTAPSCPPSWRTSWQKLANKIQAPVYCPSWLPQPLDGQFAGPSFNGESVDPDRSYLVSFAWFDTSAGLVQEVHVNFRGYPGRTRVPTCEDTLTVNRKTVHRMIPCFSDAKGTKRFGSVRATMYTANQGADQWHVLYAWRRNGSLYSVSEHVAPPYTFRQIVANLDRVTRRLVLVPDRAKS
jgi:hypothetical protein